MKSFGRSSSVGLAIAIAYSATRIHGKSSSSVSLSRFNRDLHGPWTPQRRTESGIWGTETRSSSVPVDQLLLLSLRAGAIAPATSNTSLEQQKAAEGGVTIQDESYREFLLQQWFGNDERLSAKTTTTMVLGGSFSEALRAAKQQARLLLVLIPSVSPKRPQKHTSGDMNDFDAVAVESFLSDPVAKVAEQPGRRKTQSKGSNYKSSASFLLWSAPAGSPEATVALQRIKGVQKVAATGNNKKKRPLLLVVYPAPTTVDAGRNNGVMPRLLAQHHCNPPLTGDKMAAWLKTIRKRHSKHYGVLQKQAQESLWHQERSANYQGSLVAEKTKAQAIIDRHQKQKEQAAAQEARAEHIRQRRQAFRDALAPEPPPDSNNDNGTTTTTTVALRFMAQGPQTSEIPEKRRFASDAPLRSVFDWIDAMFEIERESVVLQTMNGRQSFTWADVSKTDDEGDDDETCEAAKLTLKSAGLSNMVGLRVTIQKSNSTAVEINDPTDVDS